MVDYVDCNVENEIIVQITPMTCVSYKSIEL